MVATLLISQAMNDIRAEFEVVKGTETKYYLNCKRIEDYQSRS
jgi:hypothetical protein